jgi:hypothetical protein
LCNHVLKTQTAANAAKMVKKRRLEFRLGLAWLGLAWLGLAWLGSDDGHRWSLYMQTIETDINLFLLRNLAAFTQKDLMTYPLLLMVETEKL